jgi:hypothetical protein
LGLLVRPRISLRWLLIAFTLIAIALYVFFVHPTVRANRFVGRINGGDFGELKAIGLTEKLAVSLEDCEVSAELRPRTWRDVCKFRRKALIHVAFPNGLVIDRANAMRYYVTVHIGRVSWGDEP